MGNGQRGSNSKLRLPSDDKKWNCGRRLFLWNNAEPSPSPLLVNRCCWTLEFSAFLLHLVWFIVPHGGYCFQTCRRHARGFMPCLICTEELSVSKIHRGVKANEASGAGVQIKFFLIEENAWWCIASWFKFLLSSMLIGNNVRHFCFYHRHVYRHGSSVGLRI